MSVQSKILVTSFDVMPDSTMKPSALFKYYQQVAREHLDSVGLYFDIMRKNKCVFVITRMKTCFYKPIKGYDEISVVTASRKIKGALFTRDYIVMRGGEKVAESSTQWALINLDTRRLCRPTVYADYFPDTEELCSFCDPKKCTFETELENEYLYKVVFSDIDENYHMNNTRYSDICLDAIGGLQDGRMIEEVSIDFLSEARLSDSLVIKYKKEGDEYLFSAENLNTEKHCFNAKIKIR